MRWEHHYVHYKATQYKFLIVATKIDFANENSLFDQMASLEIELGPRKVTASDFIFKGIHQKGGWKEPGKALLDI